MPNRKNSSKTKSDVWIFQVKMVEGNKQSPLIVKLHMQSKTKEKNEIVQF